MNIIIFGNNNINYIAKLHESYRKGLRSLFTTKFWGKGYDGFDESIKSFPEIKNRLFGDDSVDLAILAECYNARNWEKGFDYCELEMLDCKKAIMLCDFWSETSDWEGFKKVVINNSIDYILSFFLYPLLYWEDIDIRDRIIWFPPSFDPELFNDWQQEKKWDVGNLNASATNYSRFYPERFKMHEILSKMSDISYLTAPHPGYGYHDPSHPLIGKNFSKTINKCKLFVTSGNLQYRNFAPKYVEIMASKSCLLAYEPLESNLIGLVDGVNYIKIDEYNLENKVRYYLEHDEEREMIAEAGYNLVINKYTCYSLAVRLYNELSKRGNG